MAPAAAKTAQHAPLTLWAHPLRYVATLVAVAAELVGSAVSFVTANYVATTAAVSAAAVLYTLFQGPPAAWVGTRDALRDHGSFVLYWVVLGVMSSIGLGSGLHTFVLFLGPFIARVAITAVTRRSVAFTTDVASYFKAPQEWTADGLVAAFMPDYKAGTFEVAAGSGSTVPSILDILLKVGWASFLWGLGTALGELPPYFIARAASTSGEALDELEEIDALEHASEGGASATKRRIGVVDRVKMAVYEAVQKYGFVAILLAASIPNPLFDLAGLTCGHFGIPFWTFFGATFVGKAVVKVSLQVMAIVVTVKHPNPIFHTLKAVVERVPWVAVRSKLEKVYHGVLASAHAYCKGDVGCAACCDDSFAELEPADCKAQCGTQSVAAEEGAVKAAFGYFLLAMLAYFLWSIINSTVQERAARDDALAAHEHTHVHGESVISALVNVHDLEHHAAPAAAAAAAAAAPAAAPVVAASPARAAAGGRSRARASSRSRTHAA